MKNYLRIALLFLLAGMTLSECDCYRICTNPLPELSFENFDSSALRSVAVMSFLNDGKFDQLQQTHYYTIGAMTGPDTLQMQDGRIILDYNTDYMVVIPGVNKTWYLKNISIQPAKMHAKYCTSGMTYTINDSVYVQLPNNISANLPGLMIIRN